VQDAETHHMEEMEKVEKEKMELSDKLNTMIKQEATLSAKVGHFLSQGRPLSQPRYGTATAGVALPQLV